MKSDADRIVVDASTGEAWLDLPPTPATWRALDLPLMSRLAIGRVDREPGERWRALDATGAPLGVYASMKDAKDAIARAWTRLRDPAPAPSLFGS